MFQNLGGWGLGFLSDVRWIVGQAAKFVARCKCNLAVPAATCFCCRSLYMLRGIIKMGVCTVALDPDNPL